MEVLIAAGILSVVSLGLVKVLGVSLNSANLGNTLVADQDLKTALSKTLETGLQCRNNLDPGNRTIVSGTDTYTLTSLKRYRGASDTTGTELIGINTFRDYLGIVKMKFIEPDADSTPDTDTHREFKVYYKREKVGHLSTRDNRPCTNTDTSGCYVHTCSLEYDRSDPLNVRCNLLSCVSLTGNVVAGVECGANEYLKGFDSKGNRICKPSQSDQECPDGEVLRGFDANGDKICKLSQANQECPDGEVLKGFDANGDKICVTSNEPPKPLPEMDLYADSCCNCCRYAYDEVKKKWRCCAEFRSFSVYGLGSKVRCINHPGHLSPDPEYREGCEETAKTKQYGFPISYLKDYPKSMDFKKYF